MSNSTNAHAGFRAEDFLKTRWLHAVFGPDESAEVMGTVEELQAMLEADPEAFFSPPYASPYEEWCLEDHKAADRLDPCYSAEQKQIAEEAYKAAWDRCPHEEFCALVSDDVQTIYALLRLTEGKLKLFTGERLNWYRKGRVPWGYKGKFPQGKWIVI